jgi:hypothetical protein
MVSHLDILLLVGVHLELALSGPTLPLCCDNCLRGRRNDPDIILTDAESRLLALMDRIRTQIRPGNPKGNPQEVIDIDTFAASADHPKRPGPRRTERLQGCRNVLIEWRARTWTENYIDCAWGPAVLLPDAILTKLATRSHISTIEDIKREIPEWDFVDDYGCAILELVQKTDEIWKEDHERKLQANKELRKRRSLENKENREEERRTKKRTKTAIRAAERKRINSSLSQPSLYPCPPSTSSHVISQGPQPWINTYSHSSYFPLPPSTSSHFLPQPIFFVPEYYPQTQPHSESRPLSPSALYQTSL